MAKFRCINCKKKFGDAKISNSDGQCPECSRIFLKIKIINYKEKQEETKKNCSETVEHFNRRIALMEGLINKG